MPPALPPALACKFTLAETAVVAVVALEAAKGGAYTLTISHIAALAGVSETTVRNALRAARGLVSIEQRRVAAFRSLSNVVRIVSPEWRAWLRMRGVGANSRGRRIQENQKAVSRPLDSNNAQGKLTSSGKPTTLEEF